MTTKNVLILGATGETGASILNGLLSYGNFVSHPAQLNNYQSTSHSQKQAVTALVRPPSAEKPEVQDLIKKGIKILIADISAPPDELVPLLLGVDIFISAISGMSVLAEKNIATAAKKAGVTRFIPCGFGTISPPWGVMLLRDYVSYTDLLPTTTPNSESTPHHK
jgi:NmrA-like family